MDDTLSKMPGQAPVRRYPRMAADFVVAFRRKLPDGSESDPQFSRTLTLGLGGLMFESDQPLDREDTLRVDIVLGEQTIVATGVVVYVDRQDGGPWKVGVQFTDITEEDRDTLLGAYLQHEYRITPT